MMRAAAGADAAEGTIRVGVVESIALTWFQSFVARIERHYPKVRLEIDADLAGGLAAKLTRRQIDIALLPGRPVDLPGSVRTSLGSCTLKWLGHPRFQGKDRALTAAALADLPTIGMPQDASVYHLMGSWFEEAGISPRFIHRCNSFICRRPAIHWCRNWLRWPAKRAGSSARSANLLISAGFRRGFDGRVPIKAAC
jgi:DNA-binding transcriptional LysR family regulator